jgi:uncharacterized protein (DUF58 family)
MFSNSPIKQVIGRFRQRIFRTRPEDTLPHAVTHQRVYIVPTKRGFAFSLALLLMLIATVNYNLSLGYALCFILSGLFAATLLHTYRNLAGIRVEQIKQFDTFAGVNATFLISLSNALKEPRHGIKISTKEGSWLMTPIGSEDTTDAALTIPTQKRGLVQLGRITLQSDWPLGLWTCWSYVHAPIRSLVFPKPETDPPPIPSSTIENGGSRSTPGMEGDVSGLRQYRPGDSIGSIAWKSAAKGMGMQVRTFDSNHSPTNAILSLEKTRHSQTEKQLSRLCAWVLEAESQKGQFALHLPGDTLASNCGEIHYRSALKALALYGIDP